MAAYKVAELTGALLDSAVAECGEWKTAHEHFPTMTLDPTFKGWRIAQDRGKDYCLLVPHNEMRQGSQFYSPSTDWRIGGPILEREGICLEFYGKQEGWRAGFDMRAGDCPGIYMEPEATGPTSLIAAMRAYVCSKFGYTVELP